MMIYPTTFLAPFLTLLSIYAAQKSYIAINRLLQYEERTEKAAKHLDKAKNDLYKTRVTQASGAAAVRIFSPFVSSHNALLFPSFSAWKDTCLDDHILSLFLRFDSTALPCPRCVVSQRSCTLTCLRDGSARKVLTRVDITLRNKLCGGVLQIRYHFHISTGQRRCHSICVHASYRILESESRSTFRYWLQRGNQEEQRSKAVACRSRSRVGNYWSGWIFLAMRGRTFLGKLVRGSEIIGGVCGKATSFISLVQFSTNMSTYKLARGLADHDECKIMATQP